MGRAILRQRGIVSRIGLAVQMLQKVPFLVRRETKLMNLVLSLKVRQLCVPHE
jgi:hypothetical protein